MKQVLDSLSPGRNIPRVVTVVVEIPAGCRNKYEIDKETGLVKLDRPLYSPVHYPGDYGFIPGTLAEDGDPLDALVVMREPTFPGCIIEARPVGVFRLRDKGEEDAKIICVANSDPLHAETRTLKDLRNHYLRAVEHFFTIYKQLEGKEVVPDGWDDVDSARAEILECVARYQGRKPKLAKASSRAKAKRAK